MLTRKVTLAVMVNGMHDKLCLVANIFQQHVITWVLRYKGKT